MSVTNYPISIEARELMEILTANEDSTQAKQPESHETATDELS